MDPELSSPEPFERYSRASILAFVAVTLIFVCARVWRLTAACLWFDEIFSVHAAEHSWSGLVKFVAADIIHPPFFYALLKVWMAIGGQSVLWMRLLPVLFGVAAIFPFALLCRELKLKPGETNLALLLMAVSGFQIKYAQILRMYTLLLFLSLFSIWLFLRFVRAQTGSRRELWALTAINLLLVYTHYYGWVLVGLECLIVLFSQRRALVSFLISTGACVLAYVPWIYEVAALRKSGGGLAQNIGWIDRPRVRDVVEFFVVFSKPFLFTQSNAERPYKPLTAWMVLGLIIVPIVVVSWRLLLNSNTRTTAWRLLTLAFAPVIFAIIFSWIFPYPIWGTRHLIISAGPFFILAAIGILRLTPYWLRILALSLLGCWILLAGAIAVLRPAPILTWCSWEGLVQQAASRGTDRAMEVYAFEDLVAYHLWFAGTRVGPGALKVTVVKNLDGSRDDPFFLPRQFDEIKVAGPSQLNGENIWLAFRARRWDETQPPVSVMKSMGYQQGRIFSRTAQGEQSFLVEFRKTNQ
ncbi:MAG TPA: glycosyltransferase family 39 protein [Pyrinomonadaceae bacterium]|nr:glycosyltransferase family 39 protein [Pyrinomonadaceae bacterium]